MAKLLYLQTSRNSFLQFQSFIETALRTSVTVPYDHTAISPQALAAAKPLEQIPGFKILPLIGTSWVFLPLIGKFSLDRATLYDRTKYETFGPISRDVFGRMNIVMINDPNDIETKFRNESKYPSRGEFSTLKTYREMRKQWFPSLGIMLLEGKEWKDLRFKVQRSMMKPKFVENYVKPMAEVASDLVKLINRNKDKNNEVPGFENELYKWSLEAVAYVGLNKRFGCLDEHLNEETANYISNIQVLADCMNRLEVIVGNIPWWKFFPTPTWKKFVRANDFCAEIALRHVKKTLDRVKAKGTAVKEDNLTLAEAMLATEGLSVEGVLTMITDMLFAGIDTTSHTLAFLLYDLAKNPEKQEKMYQEIKNVLPTSSDTITPDVLKNAEYVKYCMKESQRLNPITRGTGRILDKDIVLAGYRIPVGTIILAGTQVTGRQEKYYKNANKFIPERWMDEQNKPHSFASMPFGFGIRSCVGRRIAELEVQCTIMEIIRNFKVGYHYEDFGILTRLVNVPDKPLKFNFMNREERR